MTRPGSAIARRTSKDRAATAKPDGQKGAETTAASKKSVTIYDSTAAERLEVKRLAYEYPESFVQRQHDAKQRKEAAAGKDAARRRAVRRVKEVRGVVAKSEEKAPQASEEARWRAAAVRREQQRERKKVSAGLGKAVSKEHAELAAAAGQTLPQYDAARELERVVQDEVQSAPLQEVERLLRLVGIPPPELGQGGKAIRSQLLIDAICNGHVAGFNPSRGTPFVATALWDSIDSTYTTEHVRQVNEGRTRRKRVKQARAGTAARASQRASEGWQQRAAATAPSTAGAAARLSASSSSLQGGGPGWEHYTAAERRSAFRRDFGTHRPSSAGPERSRRLRAAKERHQARDGPPAWWPNTSQAFDGERGGVYIPPPADVSSNSTSSSRPSSAPGGGGAGDGHHRRRRRPRSAGVRRAQARRASVLREQGRANANRFDAKTGRVVTQAEDINLTPRWKNAFADDNDSQGVSHDGNFGELVGAIRKKVEAAKRQMAVDEARRAEEERVAEEARVEAEREEALLQRLAAGDLTEEEEEQIKRELGDWSSEYSYSSEEDEGEGEDEG